MNLQQLEYIVAVDNARHFAQAANACHVTQPTLSMMVRKLEEELGTQIFDRSRQPVVPTAVGEEIIAQARIILQEKQRMLDLVQQAKGTLSGTLSVGIIPTLAPYLVPRFIKPFLQTYPHIQLSLTDMQTDGILRGLKQGRIDAGILVSPLEEKDIHEQPLFYEELFAYVSEPGAKAYLLPEDIDPQQLWLLEEGHCFRSQIMNLCALRAQAETRFAYEAGSIETLMRLVEQEQGITILPELCARSIPRDRQPFLRPFAPPTPVREVSLVVHRPGLKRRLIQALTRTIADVIPRHMQESSARQVVSI